MTLSYSWADDNSTATLESIEDAVVMASGDSSHSKNEGSSQLRPSMFDSAQEQTLAKAVNTKVASTTVEAVVEARSEENAQSEIHAFRAKIKALERNVDARLAYLEDDNDRSGERLTKLEMTALLEEDNDGLEALQAKLIQLQVQVDQLGRATVLLERANTRGRDEKTKTTASPKSPQNQSKTNRARTENLVTGRSPNDNTSWWQFAIPFMATVWLLVAVMVAAFAAAVNDPNLFASAVKDGARTIALLLLWGVLASYM